MSRVIEGTWAEVASEVSNLDRHTRVRLEVLEETNAPQLITFGMFKGAGEVSEDDFRQAEWHYSAKGDES